MLNTSKLCGLVLIVGGLLLASCDFLDEPPRGSLNPEVLADEQGLEALLIGAYAALDPTTDDNGWATTIAGGNAWEAAPDNWVFGSIVGGDAKKGSDASDQPPINQIMLGDVNPSNNFLDTKWQALYEGVARTNEVLTVLEQADDLTDATRDRIEGEARFLRGHFYFELKKMWNMVPWVDENTTDPNQPNDQDIWPNIEADFEAAYQLLPETQGQIGRANSWAAASYLAKTHVYQENWSDAKALFDQIISQGQTTGGQAYDLAENYSENFHPSYQNNEESVFAIQSTGQEGSGSIAHSRPGSMLNYPYNSPFRCCGFYQPSQDLVNSFQTDGGLPMIGNYNSSMVKSDQGVSSSTEFEVHDGSLDPRLDWTVGRRGVPYLDWGPHPGARWVRDQAYAGPYAPKKHIYRQGEPEHENPNLWAPGTAVNHHIIRFADVLLMAAEAEAHLGNFEAARDYVNQVRARAANPDDFVRNEHNLDFADGTVTSSSELDASAYSVDDVVVNTSDNTTYVLISSGTWQEYPNPADNYDVSLYESSWGSADEALERIRHERRIELAMEGHRFFDLARWGIAEQTLNSYFSYEGQHSTDVSGGSFRSRAVYYPIPQRQIDLSVQEGEAQLQQNPGYN